MKELVLFLAKSLLDHPDEISVEPVEEGGAVKLMLKVSEEDKGKIIGKQGKVIKAIRSLLFVEGAKANKKVFLEIA
ncbi:MAG: KH domain-containing protein [Elusimicrobia bacterium]|nr:KH domain-containing protein [Elusimicrobiota bacterium]